MRGGEKRGRVHQHVNTRHISPMGYLLLNISKGTLAFAAGYLWNILSRDKEEREVWIALERVDSFHTLFSRRLCSAGPVYTYGLDTPYQQPSVRTHNSRHTWSASPRLSVTITICFQSRVHLRSDSSEKRLTNLVFSSETTTHQIKNHFFIS